MAGFSFVMPVTGLNRPNTGKEDDDDDLCTEMHTRNYNVSHNNQDARLLLLSKLWLFQKRRLTASESGGCALQRRPSICGTIYTLGNNSRNKFTLKLYMQAAV
jgi:hypothetical protein